MIATEFHTATPAIRGLRFRHFAGPEDYPGMAGANMAARLDAGDDAVVTAETLANQYDNLVNSDRDRDLLNPHQALHLYESCGFTPVRSMTTWRKPLAGDTETQR